MTSRTRRVFGASWAASALLLTCPLALAQEPPPGSQLPAGSQRNLTPDERARELYLRGDRLYAEGNYDEAVLAFQAAYELSRRPELLFNMANALERLGRYEEALHELNLYARYAPEHQRDVVLKRIRSLEQRAEKKRSEEPGVAEPPPPASASDQKARAALPANVPLEAPNAKKPVPVLGYTVAGAGVLSIAIGTVLGISATSTRSDAEGQCVDNGQSNVCPESADSKLSSWRGRALAADIAFGLGAAALGVGLYFVLNTDNEPGGATTALQAGATAEGGRMSLVTTF
jgi:tetratricopeptide (TPR) repeat protein